MRVGVSTKSNGTSSDSVGTQSTTCSSKHTPCPQQLVRQSGGGGGGGGGGGVKEGEGWEGGGIRAARMVGSKVVHVLTILLPFALAHTEVKCGRVFP